MTYHAKSTKTLTRFRKYLENGMQYIIALNGITVKLENGVVTVTCYENFQLYGAHLKQEHMEDVGKDVKALMKRYAIPKKYIKYFDKRMKMYSKSLRIVIKEDTDTSTE